MNIWKIKLKLKKIPFKEAKPSKTNIERTKDQRFGKGPDRDSKIREVLNMDNSGEISTEGTITSNWKGAFSEIKSFFDKKGRFIKRDSGQEIHITNTGIKKNIYEAYKKKNPLLKENFAAFKLLPQVLKNGKLINIELNRKGYGYDTYMYAAPHIDGQNKIYMYCRCK